MRAYQLYVMAEGAWSWICTIDAQTHADAFREALKCLGPGDEDRPIRLEQDTEGAYRKRFKPKKRDRRGSHRPDGPT